ncbi:multidrug resistance-associated protein 7-like [Teleopsis dalmanni]|uniref:multidrug resistance-associated protein 7-like n=1 Tax=Teleopsis dalmanni TaxID=139649 RepID=UPI0018CECA70|nr:multidrug resistance-associated protein 7-like [Teleopsis dalmanni]
MSNSIIDMYYQWNWTEFCPTGIKPFSNSSNDLLPCFQEIVLQFPVYAIFAAISAYNFGAFVRMVTRNPLQLRLIYARIVITVVLALLPVCKIFVFHHYGVPVTAVDVLIVCAECLMWIVHAGYLLAVRKFGILSHRGPLYMNVLWLSIFVLDAIWLRTSLNYDWWPWSLTTLIFDILYALTLLPKGNATFTPPQFTRDSEHEALLANRYTYFQFDFNEAHLGHAQDEANILGRLFFNWVNPLITKGVSGSLRKIEDLFDLPDSLNIARLSESLQLSISRTKTLFWALHKSFGREFYAIGILRFIADASGFAGPLLLGGLLSQQNVTNEEQVNATPYLYAFGLFATNMLSAFCGTHFRWRMSIIGMKMRIGVVSAIYRKALEARGLKDSRPEILNLMSTDTDRIVNSCISFHSFWSIPLQFAADDYRFNASLKLIQH